MSELKPKNKGSVAIGRLIAFLITPFVFLFALILFFCFELSSGWFLLALLFAAICFCVGCLFVGENISFSIPFEDKLNPALFYLLCIGSLIAAVFCFYKKEYYGGITFSFLFCGTVPCIIMPKAKSTSLVFLSVLFVVIFLVLRVVKLFLNLM